MDNAACRDGQRSTGKLRMPYAEVAKPFAFERHPAFWKNENEQQ
jgi:hypothetical protein